MDSLALEPFFLQGSGKHLPQQARAAAGGVLLLSSGAEAGTHNAALGVAACAHAHAALGGAFQGTLVGGKYKMRFKRSVGSSLHRIR